VAEEADAPVGRARPGSAPGGLLEILREIRFEQSLFSLPFALLAMVLAAGGWPDARTFLLIVAAVVTARSAAMAVNRVADAFIDARNPRTAKRAIPAGRVTRGAVALFAAVSTALFVACAWALNPLCLALAPVALAFLIGYSWTKRLTPLCHFVLGATLGIAPLGAWAAVRGTFLTDAGAVDPTPWLLGLAVATWVAGFDVVYACPDADVDRREGLRSIPASLGAVNAFRVAALLHVGTVSLLAAAGASTAVLGTAWWAALAAGAVILVAEHRLVRPGAYERMATAFFRLNAVFGVLLFCAGAADLFWRS
jgi:4-hydroxybenzoate polyprenyltransferase